MSDIEAGLSALQATTGISKGIGNALPKPKTQHPYLVGLVITTIGVFALVGSITGTLPSMFAALFVPQALEDSAGDSVAPEDTLGKIAGYANDFNPIRTLTGIFQR